jgi:hypothetical protein
MRRKKGQHALLEPLELEEDERLPYGLAAEVGLMPSAIRRFERARSEPPPPMWEIEEESED